MTFKTTRVIEFPVGLEPMFLTIYPFGICKIDCSIDWLKEFRIHMFPSSKHDYPFLRRHLRGKWWLCDRKFIDARACRNPYFWKSREAYYAAQKKKRDAFEDYWKQREEESKSVPVQYIEIRDHSNTMKLRFDVDQAECFRAGIDQPTSTAIIDIDPAKLSREDRELIAARLDGIDVFQLHKGPNGIEKKKIDGKICRILSDRPTYEGMMAAIKENEKSIQFP